MNDTSAFSKITARMRRSTKLRNQNTLSDQVVARRLYQAIETKLADADVRGLHIYVREGLVSVFGTVRDEAHRDLVDALIRQVPGVRSVDLQLQIIDHQELNIPLSQRDRDQPLV